jgi:CRP-like cAMP-binding protein
MSYKEIFPMDLLKTLINEQGTVLTLEKGAVLARQGHPFGWFIVLLEGQVKIERNALNGKNILLCYYRAGAGLPKQSTLTAEQGETLYIGDLELFRGDLRANSTVTALTDIRAVRISRDIMRDLARKNAALACELIGSLAGKMDSYSRMSAINLLYSLKARYAFHLLSSPKNLPIPIALEESAGLLGTSVRHLQRILAELEGSGCIKREGRTLRVIDRARLRMEAGSIVDE